MFLRGIAVTLILFTLIPLEGAYGETNLPFHRILYGPWNHSYEAKVGVDADYDHMWWTGGPERVLEKFKQNSMNAAEYNITYLAGIYYLGDYVDFNYTRAVHKSGKEQEHTPSPVDRTYWLRLIEEPALAVANLSLTHPIYGLTWDFELYLGDDPWRRTDYSFDESALQRFANDSGTNIPHIPPSERFGWLQGKGLLEAFKEWQANTLYEMAKATEEKVHAINPSFSLGVLNIRDSWFHWAILEAFSTPEAPVMAYTLDTYRGYDDLRMEYLRTSFEEHGLNGKVLPGLYTVRRNPWELIEDMEWATRRDGAFWVYQYNGDPYHLADERTYSRSYEIVNKYIYYNKSEAEVLPSFSLYPTAEARPYQGPEGISVFIKPVAALGFMEEVHLVTNSPNLVYIGKNLSLKILDNPNLTPSDIPCIVSGLQARDLPATNAWSLIRELDALFGWFNSLNLGRLASVESALESAISDFTAGRYEEAESGLILVFDEAYDQIFDIVFPMVQEALKSPRTSPIPISALTKIKSADGQYEKEDRLRGNAYLLAGLKEWSHAVEEPSWLWFLVIVVMLSFIIRANFLYRQGKQGLWFSCS